MKGNFYLILKIRVEIWKFLLPLEGNVSLPSHDGTALNSLVKETGGESSDAGGSLVVNIVDSALKYNQKFYERNLKEVLKRNQP